MYSIHIFSFLLLKNPCRCYKKATPGHVFWLWDLCSLFWPQSPLSAAKPQESKKKKKTKKNNWSLWFSDSLALKELRHRQGKFTAWYFSHIHLRWAGLYLISDCFPELQWYSAELLHEEYEVRGYSPEQS